MMRGNVDDILKKYERKLELEVKTDFNAPAQDYSSEFVTFKKEMMPRFSKYEDWCNIFGSFIKLKLAPADDARISRSLKEARLAVSAGEVMGLALFSFIAVFLFGLLLSVALFLLDVPASSLMLIVFLTFCVAGFLFYYFYTMPERLANEWRLKASSQMIPCILYTVIYMKHTSNLERAVRFAAEHLEPPLSFDLKKVFWDVETGRFSTIKESLDNYLENWRGYASEFIESFNLIESSLYEPAEARRVDILERSLQIILDGVYDKMLKFTHSVKAPLTNLYMLGIVLPTLGLALLPLASTLLEGIIRWYHILILFDMIVPFFVFYMTNQVMIKRPGGYGESSALELNPLYSQYKSRKPYYFAAAICAPLIILGILPFLFRTGIFGAKDYSMSELGIDFFGIGNMKLFDFVATSSGGVAGPMGTFALYLSLCIPLAVILFFSISCKERTKELIKSRDSTKVLEKEFNNSLFALGNRLADGTPAELAFSRVAESSRGTITEEFFRIVNSNIHGLGMSLERALFDTSRGAIIYYPSTLIATSMRILIESSKKGLRVASEALMSISDYVKNINKINERLKDLLADVSSDMKSNMSFLAPLLAGIVVGLGSMITLILSKLTGIIGGVSGGSEIAGLGGLGGVTSFFKLEGMIPPYFLQIVVGIYIIEIIFILTKTLVTIDAGQDELEETHELAVNLMRGGILYIVTAFIAVSALSMLAVIVIGGLGV